MHCYISTLDMVKHMLQEEYGHADEIQKSVLEVVIGILGKLKQDVENPSIAMDHDMIPLEKVKFMERQLNKIPPFESAFSHRIRLVLFVILSQLQRATLNMWRPEESPSPTNQVREIVQKLLVFVRTIRSDHESILHMQRGIANNIWRLNHLDECREWATEEGVCRININEISSDLVELNNLLLSSSIEQMVVLWPSLEYYALGRGSNPVRSSRGNSDFGIQTLINVNEPPGYITWNHGGTQWLHLALGEVLSEQKEWAGIVSSRVRSRHGGDSADMDTEFIGSLLEEALRTTSSLLGLRTDPGVICQDDGDETFSMFRIKYLDEEKIGDVNDMKTVCEINQFVSLNHILFRLRFSLDKFIEDYVRACESEDVAIQDQDMCASYFAFEDRYIFKGEDVWLPNGTSLTPKDDIPYADDAIRTADDSEDMEMFQEEFRRRILLATDKRSLRLGDAVFRLESLWDYALSHKQEVREFLVSKDMNQDAFEKKLKDAFGPGANVRGRRLLMPIQDLLFEVERDGLRKMACSGEESVLENIDRVACTIWQRENKRREMMLPENAADNVLRSAIGAIRRGDLPRRKLRARKIDVCLLMLCPVLYLLDIATDCNVAIKHLSQSNYLYFALTLLFILGPMLAEIIRNILQKLNNYRKTWKDIFVLDCLRLLPRAWRSVMYATNSRREFDQDLCVFYEEMNRLRGGHSQELSKALSESETPLISAHSFAAVVYNEKGLLHLKMHEALNESAPQLLLQLVITNVQLVNGETVGPLTIIGILVSLASFSWSLHLYHYRQHYYGLEYNFEHSYRATDFLAHFLIVGCRFVAVSTVVALYPMWFLVVAFFYLGFLFIYLYYFSSDRYDYRELTTETSNTLWMAHRLFITPYNWKIWCIDRYDDVLYHFETFVLALPWPFLLDGGHPLSDYRWIISATILILNFIALPLLLRHNRTTIEPSPLCEEHNWFPLKWWIMYNLKAEKTVVERLFGRNTGPTTGNGPTIDESKTAV